MALKPPRLNTQGPVEEFLRQVYNWSLDVATSATLDLLEAAIAALDTRVDAAEADITGLQTDVAAHETRIDDLEADVANHETRIDALEADETLQKTHTFYFRGDSLLATAATAAYLQPYVGSVTATIQNAQLMANSDGKFRNLSFKMITTTADTDTFSLTLNINGADQTLTLTGLNCADGTLQSDTTHEVTVSKGAFWCIKQQNDANSITSNDWACSIDFVVG